MDPKAVIILDPVNLNVIKDSWLRVAVTGSAATVPCP
jgi:hypothetical protein